jgi:hypothetical protein
MCPPLLPRALSRSLSCALSPSPSPTRSLTRSCAQDEGTQISFGQEPIEQRRSQPNLPSNEAPDLTALKQSMMRRGSLQTGGTVRQTQPSAAPSSVAPPVHFVRKPIGGNGAGARLVLPSASSYGARQPQPPVRAVRPPLPPSRQNPPQPPV